jgi:hypothetical protein
MDFISVIISKQSVEVARESSVSRRKEWTLAGQNAGSDLMSATGIPLLVVFSTSEHVISPNSNTHSKAFEDTACICNHFPFHKIYLRWPPFHYISVQEEISHTSHSYIPPNFLPESDMPFLLSFVC